MSIKTSLKRVAAIAAAALVVGGFSAVTANAAAATLASTDFVSKTMASGQSLTGTIAVTGSNNDTATVTITPSASTVSATWSFADNRGNRTGVSATPSSGSATYATPGTSVLARTTGGSTGTIDLTVTISGTAGTVTVSGGGLSAVLTLSTTGTQSPTSDNPFVVNAGTGVTAGTPTTLGLSAASISVTKAVSSSTDYTRITAAADTVGLSGNGNYRYVEVTGGVIKAVSSGTVWTLNGLAGSATQAAAVQSGLINGSYIDILTGTASQTITVKFFERIEDQVTGFVTTKLLQTITITTAAYSGLNAAKSAAVICAEHGVNDAGGTYPKAVDSSCTTGVLNATATTLSDDVLAKAAIAGVGGTYSGVGTAKAVIKVFLNDVNGTGLVGTLPAVGASISGPGTLSIGTTPNADASTGRLLTATAAPANVFYINVFSDGSSGEATISIWVNGAVWKTKNVIFYGAPTKLVASSGLKVLKAGTSYAVPSTSCALAVPAADCGTTFAKTPVVQVLATDANGMQVPGLSYTAVPDGTVILANTSVSNAGDAVADSIGATWFGFTTSPSAASGATGSVSYKTLLADGTTYLTSNSVSFAIGGSVASIAMTLGSTSSSEIGAKNSLLFTAKDSAGNAPYDQDYAVYSLKSNVALVSGTNAATSGLPTGTIFLVGGTNTANFFNPQTAQEVTISGLMGAAGTLPVSLTYTVSNSDTQAAIDAANEATDAANAATDAANAAAEAADAATAAAQDAQAAVAELAAQVAALIAGIKAQIIRLTNLVVKIQKKVKA